MKKKSESQDVADTKKSLTAVKQQLALNSKTLLNTGSTLLNLACTGKPYGGFAKGTYILLVGDSSSGKTWLSMTCLAEAAMNPEFKDYRFIFDNAENGAMMNIEKFFGSAVASKLEPPAGTRENPKNSSTVEEFYFHLDDAIKQNKPFIYILDSMDALDTEDDIEQFQKEKDAYEKDKNVTGSFGTSKAKKNSHIRVIGNQLPKTGSIVIVISQTRQSIGFGAQLNPKTRSGGKALKFFCHLELWSSVKGDIKKKVKGKDRQQGIISKIKVEKNRYTGRERVVEIPIYHSFGIDDIGSCVDFLVEEGHWKKSDSGSIDATDFEITGKREFLIQEIERRDMEKDLRLLVAEVWDEIEEASKIERKTRYT